MGAEQGVADRRTWMRAFVTTMMGIMVYATGSFPQALHIMWSTSSWCALVIAQILRRPATKKFFNIPEIRQVLPPKTAEELVTENLKLLQKKSKGQK